jgi:catechol 2,3-dioxygenase-like lactoylglutathione lyase family enzyme
MADEYTLTHIGICVSDIDRSVRFYRDGLGFKHVSELEVAGEPAATLLRLNGVKLRAVYLERDGVRIELLHYASPPRKPPPRPHEMNDLGFTHMSFHVTDIEAALGALREAGAEILEDTVVSIPGGDRVAAFVADPDGVLIELVAVHG